MKFGKLYDISQVDFSLAPEDPRTQQLLPTYQEANSSFKVYVGCPVWGNKAWIGKIYPKGAKTNEYLGYYSQSFNTIELNSTHYGMPKVETIIGWKEKAQNDFVFCPKFPQEISHYQKLTGNPERTQLFCERIGLFEEKLGCAFVQLPPTFGLSHFKNLENFVKDFPNFVPLAIEFRHEDWFENRMLVPAAFELLKEHRIGTVISDVSGRRDVSHSSLTNGTAMLRFVGNGLHPTDYSRFDSWVDRFESWKAQGLHTLYLLIHEPDDTYAPDMAMYAIEQLNRRFGLSITMPSVPDNAGGQLSLF